MKINEVIDLKRDPLCEALSLDQETNFKSGWITASKVIGIIGAVGVAALGAFRFPWLLDNFDSLGIYPVIAATLSPIIILITTAEMVKTNEAKYISISAMQLSKVVNERDKLLRKMERVADSEAFLKKNASVIKRLTQAQQLHAGKLKDAIATDRGKAFVRDHLEPKSHKALYDSIAAAEKGTLSELVKKNRPTNEALSRFKFNNPFTILATVVSMAVAGSIVGSQYNMFSSMLNAPDRAVVFASLAAVGGIIRTLKLSAVSEFNQMFSTLRDLEEVVKTRDILFQEFIKEHKRGKGEKWMAANSQTIAALTKQQQVFATRLEKAVSSPATMKALDAGLKERKKALFAALDAAKKGTLSDVLANRALR